MDFLPPLLRFVAPALQIGPTPTPEELAAFTGVFFVLLAVRLVAAPAIYWAARATVGRESWFGLLAVISPLVALIAFLLVPKRSSRPAPAAWNPWVMCPFCGTPRGWSPTPCPRCGQFLPVGGMAPYMPPPYSAPFPAPAAYAPAPPPPLPPPTLAPAAPAAPPAPEPRKGPPSGRGVDISTGQVVGALLFALAFAVIATFAALIPAIAAGGLAVLNGLDSSPEFILLSLLLQDSILLAICFDQSLFQGRLTRAEMGLSLKPAARGLPWQVGIGVAAGVVTFAFSAFFVDGLTRLFSPFGVPSTGPELPGTPVIKNGYDYVLWLISGCVIAPLAEETFFRGYALGGFKKRGLTNFGLVFSSLAFAAVHMNPIGFIPLTAAGMMMGGLYLKTGSLAAPMAAHATNNFIVTTLVLLGY